MKSIPPATEAVKKSIRLESALVRPQTTPLTTGNFPFAHPATYCERGARVRFLNGSVFFPASSQGGTDCMTQGSRALNGCGFILTPDSCLLTPDF
jgi:hypothetical protein